MRCVLSVFVLFACLSMKAQHSDSTHTGDELHNIKLATTLSLIPGGGQIYNGKYWKAPIFWAGICLLYTSPSPRDVEESRMPSSA